MIDKKLFDYGEKAPDFILNDQRKLEFKLSDFKGKNILLSFHPLAWTPVCTDQMRSLEKNYDTFQELNTIAVGISVDSVPSKNAWAKSINIKNTRLLSDFWPHGKVAKLFSLFREKDGFSERANIIINEDQTIEFKNVYDITELPDINEILEFLKTL